MLRLRLLLKYLGKGICLSIAVACRRLVLAFDVDEVLLAILLSLLDALLNVSKVTFSGSQHPRLEPFLGLYIGLYQVLSENTRPLLEELPCLALFLYLGDLVREFINVLVQLLPYGLEYVVSDLAQLLVEGAAGDLELRTEVLPLVVLQVMALDVMHLLMECLLSELIEVGRRLLLLLLPLVVGEQAHRVLHLCRCQLLLVLEEGLEFALKLLVPEALSVLPDFCLRVDLWSGCAC